MVMVLFVCTGNAARSQMAEGWLKNLNSDVSVISAGTKPEGVSKIAIKVMKEIGIDISNHTSDNLNNVDWQGADFAITLCGSANETCVSMPWPETCKRLHWPIKDPVSEDEYRNARDEIKQKINNFFDNPKEDRSKLFLEQIL
mgnify:FL=1|tara:strand:- start:122 stop:550 length:429 start_codon:yes stop_codon:yes gene_type:complete